MKTYHSYPPPPPPKNHAFLLSLLPHLTLRGYWSLIAAYGSAKQALTSPIKQFSKLSSDDKQLLIDFQKHGNNSKLAQKAEAIQSQLNDIEARIITFDQEEYLTLLNTIYSPPPVLYIRGNHDVLHLPQLAMVGSRHGSIQGKKNTQLFAKHLCQHGFTITSGLALGIDQEAHSATLDAGGTTIAVMATGIEQIYPKQHQTLARHIIDNGGALITESPPGSPPTANRFPQRNRIISGFSVGVLVVEATLRSGSLITARYAMEEGREVFTIPGAIHNPQSRGCHHVIKQGATLVENSVDIVEHLDCILEHLKTYQPENIKDQSPKTEMLSKEEGQLLQCMGFDALTQKELIQATNLDSQTVSQALINLEISGIVQRSHRGYEKV